MQQEPNSTPLCPPPPLPFQQQLCLLHVRVSKRRLLYIAILLLNVHIAVHLASCWHTLSILLLILGLSGMCHGGLRQEGGLFRLGCSSILVRVDFHFIWAGCLRFERR